MILGLGNDFVDIRRIEKSLERFGDRFVQRIFTATEQKRSEGRATRAASYAKRFAAKEACSKALGTGLRRGVFWRDMGVINQRGGRPTMALTGGALARLEELTPPGMSPQIDLTLTEFDMVAMMAQRAGRDVTYRELYDLVHGSGFQSGAGSDGYRSNVRGFIKRIRRKFETIDPGFTAIENYPGFGYRWRPPGTS